MSTRAETTVVTKMILYGMTRFPSLIHRFHRKNVVRLLDPNARDQRDAGLMLTHMFRTTICSLCACVVFAALLDPGLLSRLRIVAPPSAYNAAEVFSVDLFQFGTLVFWVAVLFRALLPRVCLDSGVPHGLRKQRRFGQVFTWTLGRDIWFDVVVIGFLILSVVGFLDFQYGEWPIAPILLLCESIPWAIALLVAIRLVRFGVMKR